MSAQTFHPLAAPDQAPGLTMPSVAGLKLAGMVVAGGLLSGLVLTTTLPNALAPASPELALRLDPSHPGALLTIATRQHAEWLKLARPPTAEVPHPAPLSAEEEARRGRLAQSLRELADRLLAADPTHATAHRLLGELASDPAVARQHMRTALAASRREWVAALWLMHDGLQRRDHGTALKMADLLMRGHPSKTAVALPVLAALSEVPAARPALAAVLKDQPRWRPSFFKQLPTLVRDHRSVLALMLALRDAGSPPSDAEQASYLNHLISQTQGEAAYYAWLQFLPPQTQRTLPLLTNGQFETDPTGLPFDWRIGGKSINVTVRIDPPSARVTATGHTAGGRLLHVTFGNGRVQFPAVEQWLALAPGRYDFSGQQLIDVTATRGLRWRVTCAGSGRLAETEMAVGFGRSWSPLSLTFDVPADGSCSTQKVHLVHDARSASEQFAKGEAWYDGLRLTWITPTTAPD